MKFGYEDYLLELRKVGEAIQMDLAYVWERRFFNREYNRQIIADKNINSNDVLSIMIMANSFLETNLFVGLLKHPNFKAKSIGYWIHADKPNGELHRKQFYLNTIRHHEELVTSDFINRALEQFNTDIWVAMLKNETVSSKMSLHDKVELLKSNRENSNFTERVMNIPHLENAYLKVFENYNIDIYLPDGARELFLF
jgi:hypothetical protein